MSLHSPLICGHLHGFGDDRIFSKTARTYTNRASYFELLLIFEVYGNGTDISITGISIGVLQNPLVYL